VRRFVGVIVLALGMTPVSSYGGEPSSDPAADTAEQLGDDAYRAFEEGKLREAIALYERAFDAAPSARFLLNIAEIYERLHDAERAAAYYRRYVEAPDAETELAARARERLDAPPPPAADMPKTEPTTQATPPAAPSPLRTWGFVLGGTGLGVVVLGAVLGLVAKSKNDEAGRSCVGQKCSDPRALSLTDQAAGLATAADVAFVTGGLLTAGGLTLVLLSPTPALPVRGLALSGTFR
jgi:tetratricopeptide (TPR) repeat protein